MIVATNTYTLAELAAAIATAGQLHGAIIALFQSSNAINRQLVLTDPSIVECDFHGYARSAAIVWTGPFLDPATIPTLVGDLKAFVATTGGTLNPQTVYWYAILDSTGANILLAEAFNPPRAVANVGDPVFVVPQVQEVSMSG